MPKVLLYISSKVMWTFLFYGTDVYENRAHVHVGKKGDDLFAKIWLEPDVTPANQGALTESQMKQVLAIVEENKKVLLEQWNNFVQGKSIRIIKIKR